MSNPLVNRVRKITVGHPIAKAILLYLADCKNPKTGKCNPSQKTIADELELSLASVKRYLQYLESKSLIARETIQQNRRTSSTFYTFNGVSQIPFPQTPSIPQTPPPVPTDTTYIKEVLNPKLTPNIVSNETVMLSADDLAGKEFTPYQILFDHHYQRLGGITDAKVQGQAINKILKLANVTVEDATACYDDQIRELKTEPKGWRSRVNWCTVHSEILEWKAQQTPAAAPIKIDRQVEWFPLPEIAREVVEC